MTAIRRLALVVPAWLALGAGAACAQQPAAHGIERLGWLAGCWERRAGDRLLEEQWMAPRGGIMLGMSRSVRAGRVVEYEYVRIEERGDALVFIADPSGQEVAEFASASVADSAAVFENPAHDFPRRIVYRHAPGDSLHARIEGPAPGAVAADVATRTIDFRMGRVACTH